MALLKEARLRGALSDATTPNEDQALSLRVYLDILVYACLTPGYNVKVFKSDARHGGRREAIMVRQRAPVLAVLSKDMRAVVLIVALNDDPLNGQYAWLVVPGRI